MATDGGEPAFSSSATLVVEVEDDNDNGPVFSSPVDGGVLRLELDEDAAPGTEVHRFAATDADDGDNGRVSYRLDASSSSAAAAKHFYLDPLTGEEDMVKIQAF